MIRVIPISEKPNYIVITNYDKDSTVQYHLKTLVINKLVDIGVWYIKYKTKLDN